MAKLQRVVGQEHGPQGVFSPAYRTYMLVVLVLIYIFNGVDRSLMWVLLEPIKHELDLTDSQLGWLSGFAFGVFYALAGVPIGMLADRTERRRIIAAAVGVWSLMTASCGFTSGFWALFGVRVAVGVAEAGAPPASISFLSDLYDKRFRASVVGIYMSGTSIALVLTYAIGGWVGARIGWRMTFLAAGIPGLVLAALVGLTFKEPRRDAGEEASRSRSAPPFGATVGIIFRRIPIRWLLIGLTMSSIASVGLATFMTSFLMRSHHLSITRAGITIALSHTFAAFCIAAVGRLADKLSAKDPRWAMWLPAVIVTFGVPLALAALLTPSISAVYITLPLLSAVGGSQVGPLYAHLQSTVMTTMRTTTMSIAYGLQNLVGIGLGAVVVGTISDRLKPEFGGDSLRYAMVTASAFFLVAACCYLRGAAGMRADQPFAQHALA